MLFYIFAHYDTRSGHLRQKGIANDIVIILLTNPYYI